MVTATASTRLVHGACTNKPCINQPDATQDAARAPISRGMVRVHQPAGPVPENKQTNKQTNKRQDSTLRNRRGNKTDDRTSQCARGRERSRLK